MKFSKEQQTVIDEYVDLRKKVLEATSILHEKHQKHTQCSKGCAECCIKFSVFPIELAYLLHHLKTDSILKAENNGQKCIFLKNNICSMYEYRPFICISHGLPILHVNEHSDDNELSFCPLNFSDVTDDYFDYSNILEFDRYNSQLFQLNHKFIELNTNEPFKENTLIEITKSNLEKLKTLNV